MPVSGIEPGVLYDDRLFLVDRQQLAAFERAPHAAIIGADVAHEWGWEIGDEVPLQSWGMRKADGSNTWRFLVVGTYETSHDLPTTNFYVRFSYVDGLRMTGKGRVDSYLLTLDDEKLKSAVVSVIDNHFLNSADPTRSISLKDRARTQRRQMGSMDILIKGVTTSTFLALAIVLLAVLTQLFRLRAKDVSVLRTLGFGMGPIVAIFMVEALVYVGAGLITGLLAALMIVPQVIGAAGLADFGLSRELLLRNFLLGIALAAIITASGVAVVWRRDVVGTLDASH